ncbi:MULTISPECIES: C40 family peptidase [Bifidobacterium]|uniref:Peptidase P60 n=2 Tax=Bifidobacterium TaxID=1678 RepID=A0A2M9HRL0_9BIFI|nr:MULTISPECIES: C40 family peptidase [Bifidobacterium]NMM97278.1 peptidase P60 [Bifidobacterium sp. DSM 109959]PJM79399.1 peptidase P60 [Bifidobacterium scaligerum]
MNIKQIVSTSAAVVAAGAMCVCVAPAAFADSAQSGTVVSSRSFPKAGSSQTNLLAESTSTSTDDGSNWGGLENLDVPQTESPAEKQAALEAAQKAADEAAAAQTAAEEAASRSEQRTAIPQVDLGKMTGSGAELAKYATQFQGSPYVAAGNTPSGWDCSGFVQYVFAQFGISLPRSSGAQATVGTPVGSIAEAQPGDILANGIHAAIYIGNGQVINALNPYQGTQITDLSVFGGNAYSIRRVM